MINNPFNNTEDSFSQADDIFNYKPKFEYQEPPQDTSNEPLVQEEVIPTIDEVRKRTEDLVAGYKQLAILAEQTQAKIDERVNKGNNLVIQLDPNRDAHVIAAIKRRFPKTDPTKITYDMYRKSMDKISIHASDDKNISRISEKDLLDSQQDPYRTQFGGMGKIAGTNRPEITNPANNIISPLDMTAFQIMVALGIFSMIKPMVEASNAKAVAQHMATVPHT